jgi:hypothetical protein
MDNTFRDRKARYRKSHKTFSLSFSLEKAKALKEEAKRYNKTSPELIKSLVDACLNGTGYIVPKEANLQALSLAMRRIGSNLNQVVRHIHVEGVITHRDIECLQKHLFELETEIKSALTKPTSIKDFLIEQFSENPETFQPFKDWLNQYDNDNKGASC